MSEDNLSDRIRRQELYLQAAFGEMAELRSLLEGTLTGVANLSDLKAKDINALGRIEERLDRVENEQGDIKALVQDIRNKLNDSGL